MGPGFESLKVHQNGDRGKLDPHEYSAKRVRVNIAEGPPVPIPNTEVKLCYADNTCLETDWEDRSMRTQVTVTLYNTAMLCCLPLLLDISVFWEVSIIC